MQVQQYNTEATKLVKGICFCWMDLNACLISPYRLEEWNELCDRNEIRPFAPKSFLRLITSLSAVYTCHFWRNSRSDFLFWWMWRVDEWRGRTYAQKIRPSSTGSHPSEEEYRTRNRSANIGWDKTRIRTDWHADGRTDGRTKRIKCGCVQKG